MDAVITLDDTEGMYLPRRDRSTRPDETRLDQTPIYYNQPPVERIDQPPIEPLVESQHVLIDQPAIDQPSQSGEEGRSNYSSAPRARRRKKTKKKDNVYYRHLQYTIDEVPPWYICLFLGFQHYLIMFGATMSNPLVLADKLCIPPDDYSTKSQLVSTIFVVSGVCTLLQTTLGVRLPLVQGGTFTFVAPSIALLSLPEWECPKASPRGPGLMVNTSLYNTSDVYTSMSTTTMAMTAAPLTPAEPIYLSRIREVQGAIMVASLFQIVLGFTGVMGFMLRFIGPLAIAPTIALAGLALFEVAADYSSQQWWITLVTVILIAAFSQYSRHIKIPCPVFERGTGCKAQPFPIFRLFPVLLAISITWIICAVLTVAGAFPAQGSWAKTNLRLDLFYKASWFKVPYPGQWGLPTVSTAGVFGMLAGVLAGMVESLGDYYACARMSRVPPPPIHALNRGIGIEGIGCLLAGAWGSGTGTTTYSENIGAIGITKVGSRSVIQCAAVFMIVFGIFGKFGAAFATIPKPITGGVFIVMFGMVAAVGISNLQFVDLNSSRNLFIIGFSFFFGLTLPTYLLHHRGAIQTGSPVFDQIVTVLLSTSMFVGGLAGFVLDNTIPGTDEERGLTKWREQMDLPGDTAGNSSNSSCYDMPLLTRLLERWSWTRYVPFLPTYQTNYNNRCCQQRRKRKRKGRSERQANNV